MATFDDLKESAEKFADTIEKICDNEDFDEYDAIEHILENTDSFKRWVQNVEEDQEGPAEVDQTEAEIEAFYGEPDEKMPDDEECDEEMPERTITPGYQGGSPVCDENAPDEPETFEDLGI